MTTPAKSSTVLTPGATLLHRAGLAWYLTAAIGQLAFVWMIVAHYGRRTLGGDYAGWNDKPIIKGYVAGDTLGNILFVVHVLLAAIVTLGGLFQLIPWARRHLPSLHRWNGRLFIAVSCVMAVGGIWMTWGRHTYLSVISGIAVTVDGVLILLFATIAWRLAAARQFDAHRKWAMRTFIVVNGVWFLRIFIMAWAVLTHGAGMSKDMSSPVDIALQFGAYLLPLAVLEVYFLAQRSHSLAAKRAVAGLVIVMTVLMAIGIFGAIAFMWGPYMKV